MKSFSWEPVPEGYEPNKRKHLKKDLKYGGVLTTEINKDGKFEGRGVKVENENDDGQITVS